MCVQDDLEDLITAVLGLTWYSVIVGDVGGHTWYMDEYSRFHSNDRQNFGFADGHVETLSRLETFNDSYDRWKAIK